MRRGLSGCMQVPIVTQERQGYLRRAGADVEQEAAHFIQAAVRAPLVMPQLQACTRWSLQKLFCFSVSLTASINVL